CQRNPSFEIDLEQIQQGCLEVHHKLGIEEVHHSHRFDICHAKAIEIAPNLSPNAGPCCASVDVKGLRLA
ncbi:hypothetical protein CFP56_013885, partial [Quercus suber]